MRPSKEIENFGKEIQAIKKNLIEILELKSITTKIKSSIEELDS